MMSLSAVRGKPSRRNSDATACRHTNPAAIEIHNFV